MAPDLYEINLQDPAIRHHFYIQMAKKRVRPGSGVCTGRSASHFAALPRSSENAGWTRDRHR